MFIRALIVDAQLAITLVERANMHTCRLPIFGSVQMCQCVRRCA